MIMSLSRVLQRFRERRTNRVPRRRHTREITQELEPRLLLTAPYSADDSYDVDPAFGLVVDESSGVLANDFDLDGHLLEASLVTQPAYGMLLLEIDGSFTYSPYPGFTGVDQFTYQAVDFLENGNTATVMLNVGTSGGGGSGNGNSAPVGVADGYTLTDSLSTIDAASGVLANDHDPDGDSFTAELVSNPGFGSVSLSADGSFVFDPTGQSGTTSFTYRPFDGSDHGPVTSVSLIVAGAGGGSIATDDKFFVESQSYDVELDVLMNDTVSGTLSISQGPNFGSAYVDYGMHTAGDVVFYTPTGQLDDQFTYTNSAMSGSDDAVVSVDIHQVDNTIAQARPIDGSTVSQTGGIIGDGPQAWSDVDMFAVVLAAGDQLSVDVDALFDDSGTPISSLVSRLRLFTSTGVELLSVTSGVDPDTGLSGSDPVLTYTTAAAGTFYVGLSDEGNSDYSPHVSGGGFSYSYGAYLIDFEVVASNTAPESTADVATVHHSSSVDIDVLSNDTDPDGDTLTLASVSSPPNGVAEVVSTVDGPRARYTPNPGFTGTDSFSYTITDPMGAQSSSIVTVQVTNTIPQAFDDVFATAKDTVLSSGNVLQNDIDADADALSVTLSSPASHGTVTLSSDGDFDYVPAAGFVGVDSFSYTASDQAGISNVATVSVTVHAAATMAYDDSYIVGHDTTLNVGVEDGVVVNDWDLEDDPLNALVESLPSNGSLSLNANGAFTYTPDAGYEGSDSFTYRATDEINQSAVATVTIQVTNFAPLAGGDNFELSHDSQLTVPSGVILANDTDIENDALTASVETVPEYGSLTFSSDGSFTYVPNAGFVGVDSFAYRVNDGIHDSNVAQVTLNVLNWAPVAENDFFSTAAASELLISTADLAANDSDGDGDPLSFSLETTTTNGTLTFSAGTWSYMPHAGFSGTDSFSYRATDSIGAFDVAIATIRVANTSPTATNDIFFVSHDRPLVVSENGLLTNDIDNEDDQLQALLSSVPQSGTLTLALDGTFTYVANPGFVGTDSFSYVADDGLEASTPATVTIEVTNSEAVTRSDTYHTRHDHIFSTNTENGVLANDTDADSDTLIVSLISTVSNGTVTLSPDGSFLYTPNPSFVGTDSFTYSASDGVASSTPTEVTLVVRNTQPIANSDQYSTAHDRLLSVSAIDGLLSNDVDADGDTLSVSLSAGVTNGTLLLNADGSFDYAPNAGFVGADQFTYVVSDGAVDSLEATVVLNITNTKPNAGDRRFALLHDRAITVAAPGLLAFSSDAESDSLTVSLVNSPGSGSVTVNADGSFHYVPAAGFVGEDHFTYSIADGLTSSTPASVTLTVFNSTPQTANDNYTVTHDTILTVDPTSSLLTNDVDLDGDELAISVLPGQGPTSGSLLLNPDGTFVYTPNAGFSGEDGFTYTVNDGAKSSTADVQIIVLNSAPVATLDVYGVEPDTTLTVGSVEGLLNNDTDADSDTLSAVLAGAPSNGSVAIQSDGSFTYTPDAGFIGVDQFTYRVTDTLGVESSPTLVEISTALVANDDRFAIGHDRSINGNVLNNDYQANGNPLSVTLTEQVSEGSLTITADGNFTYTPPAQFTGSVEFAYFLDDFTIQSNPARVRIDVVNDTPRVYDSTWRVVHGNQLQTDIGSGLQSRSSDADGDPLSFSITSPPQFGSLTLVASGTFTYVPFDSSFVGTDSFGWTTSDGLATSEPAIATISVTNEVSRSRDDVYRVHVSEALSPTIDGSVLSNDTDADSDTLTVELVTSPSNGLLTLNTDGTFHYVPDANVPNNIETFSYRIFDGAEYSDTANVAIEVFNSAPQANNETYRSSHSRSLVVDPVDGLLANALDADGDQLTVVIVQPPTHGTLTTGTDGAFVYTPHQGFVGNDTVTYRISDGYEDSAVTAVTFDLSNGAPATNEDLVVTRRGSAITFSSADLTANDRDVDGDVLQIASVSSPTNGALVDNGDGTWTYTPNAGYTGTDSLTYQVTDGVTNSPATTLFLDVLNAAPQSADDRFEISHGRIHSEATGSLTANDYDLESDPISVSLESNVAHGVLTLQADGAFTYLPDAGFEGRDRFTYVLNDGDLDSETATVVLDVVNHRPAIHDSRSRVTHGTALSVDAQSGVLSSARDDDDDDLQALLVSNTNYGNVTLSADGSWTYVPDAGFVGTDSFVYRVSDGAKDSAAATVFIDVQNAPVVATQDTYVLDPGNTLSIAAPGILANDSDVDGDSLTITLLEDVNNGTLNLNQDGSFLFTPNAGFVGTDEFTYRVFDGIDYADSTVDLTVTGVNATPPAEPRVRNDFYNVDHSSTLSLSAYEGVLANDTDLQNDNLTVQLLMAPAHGTLTLNADGSFDYTPSPAVGATPAFTGIDSFSYIVTDGTNQTNGTAEINVRNRAPVVSNSTFAVQQGQSIPSDIGTLNEFANDADGDSLSFELMGSTANGSLSLNPDGTFEYIPNTGYSGVDSFSYRVSDSVGNSEVATVSLDVSNERPSAYQLEFNTQHDSAYADTGNGVLYSAFDPDGDSLTASLAAAPQNGTAVVNSDGTFTYTPEPGFSGTDEFRFVVNDGVADSYESRVVIHVNNESPVVQPTTAFATHTGSTAVRLPATDPDGDTVTFELVSTPSNGTLTYDQLINDGSNGQPITFSGNATWTPATGYVGTDSFQYRATDGLGYSETATVSLTSTNFTPVATQTNEVASRETDFVVDGIGLFAHASDSDNDALQIEVVTGPSNGTVTLTTENGENTGGYTYSPNAGFAGDDSFTWRVFDGAEWSEPASVNIAVDNNTPTLAGTHVHARHNDGADVGTARTYSFELPTNAIAADLDGDQLSFELVSQPEHGTATLSATGELTYSSTSTTFVGADTVEVRVTDGYVTSDVAEIRIDITNTAPAAISDSSTTVRNGSLTFTAADLTNNDVDLDGDSLQIVSVNVGSEGTLTESGGTYTFQPGDFVGTTELTYQVTDGLTVSDPITLRIEVKNAPVWALDKSFDVTENSTLGFAFSTEDGSLYNPDNDSVTFNIIEGPQNGTLTGGATPTGYAANSGYIGRDSFTFTVSDGLSVSAPVTYSFLVKDTVSSNPSGGSSIPGEWTAFLDSTTPGVVSETKDLTIIGAKRIRVRPGESAQETLPLNGASIHSAVVDGVTTLLNGGTNTVDFGQGTMTVDASGLITFSGGGFGGTRSEVLLNLTQDGRTETVQFNIDVLNVAPSVGDVVIVGDAGDVSQFAFDLDGDSITYTTSHPDVTISPTGIATFSPSGPAATESFAQPITVTATDQHGLATSFQTTFVMTVIQSYEDPSANAPPPTATTPLAAPDELTFTAAGAAMGNVLNNDTKRGPGPWTAQLESPGVGSNGTLEILADGIAKFSLLPFQEHVFLATGQEATEFFYSITNGLGEKTYGSVKVNAKVLAAGETGSYGNSTVVNGPISGALRVAFGTDSGDVTLRPVNPAADHMVNHYGGDNLYWKENTSGHLSLSSEGAILSPIQNSGTLGLGADDLPQPVMANSGTISSENSLNSVQATGDLDGVWAVTSAGAISVGGNLYDLSLGFESSSPVQTTGRVLNTPVNVGGDLWWTHVEGTYTGNLTVGGNMGGLEVTDDLAGSIKASGTIGDSDSIGYGVQATILGSLSGILEAGGDIFQVDVSDVTGSIDAGGDVGQLDAQSIAGTVNAGGSVHTVISEQAIAGEITAGQNVGSVTATQAFSGAISAGNDIGTVSATSVDGLISAGNGSIGSITATVSSVNSPTITAGASIGSIQAAGGSIIASGGIQAQSGYIGSVTAGHAVEATIDAADNVGSVSAGTSFRGSVMSEYGSVGSVTAGSGSVEGSIEAGENVDSISAGLSISGSVSAGRSIGSVTTTYSSISGSFNAGTNIGNILAATDFEGDVSAGGNINTIESGASASTGGNISGSLTAGGGIAAVRANGIVTGSVGIAAIDAALLAAAVISDSALPKPALTFTSSGGNIEATIQAVSFVGGVSADGTIKGEITSMGSVGGVSALKDIDATITSGTGSTSVTSSGGGIKGSIKAAGGASASAYGDLEAEISASNGSVSASSWGSVTGDLNGHFGVGASALGDVSPGMISSAAGSVTASSAASITAQIDAAESAAAMARMQVDVGAGLAAHNGNALLLGIQGISGFISAHESAIVNTFGSLTGTLLADTDSIQVVAEESTADLIAEGGGIFVNTLSQISGRLHAGNGDIVAESESVTPNSINAPNGGVQILAYSEFSSTVYAENSVQAQVFGSTSGSLTSQSGGVSLTTIDGGDASLVANGSGNISVVSWSSLSGSLYSAGGNVSVFALGDVDAGVTAGGTATVYAWGDTGGEISGNQGVSVVARNNVAKSLTSAGGSIEVQAGGDVSGSVKALSGSVAVNILGEVSSSVTAGNSISIDARSASADLIATSGSVSVVVLESYNGTLRAGGGVDVSAGDSIQAAGGVRAGGSVSLRSIGSISGASVTAGGDAMVSSSNQISGLNVKKANSVTVSGLSGVNGLSVTNNGSTVVYSGAGITGSATSLGDVTLLAVDAATGAYTSTSGNVSATAYGSISGTLTATTGSVSALGNEQVSATLSAAGGVTALSLGDVTVTLSGSSGSVTAGGQATVTASGALNDVSVAARNAISGSINVTGSANLTSIAEQISASVTAGRSATLSAISGNVGGTATSPGGSVSVLAGGNASGNVTAGNTATVRAVGDATASIQGKGGVQVSALGMVSGQVSSNYGSASVFAGGSVSGEVSALKDVTVSSGAGGVSGSVQSIASSASVSGLTDIAGDVTAARDVSVSSLGGITGSLSATSGNVSAATLGGGISGSISAGGDASVTAFSTVSTSVAAGGSASIASFGNVNASVNAGDSISVSSLGETKGSLTAGDSVYVSSFGNATPGSVTATAGDAVISSAQDVTTLINAGGSAAVLSGGSANVIASADQDAFVMALGGQSIVSLTAGQTAFGWSAGSLAGTIEGTAGSAGAMAFGTFAGSVKAGEDAFVFSFGMMNAQVEAGGSAVGIGMSLTAGSFDAGGDAYVFSLESAQPLSLTAGGSAGLISLGGSNAIVEGVESAVAWTAGDFTGTVTSTAGSAGIVAIGRAAGANVTAATDAFVMTGGSFSGGVAAGNSAVVITLLDNSGSATAGDDVFFISYGDVSGSASAGGDAFAVAVGSVSASLSADGDVGVFTYSDFSGSLSAGSDVVGVYAVGDLSGTIQADGNVGAGAATSQYDSIFSHGSVLAHIQAGSTGASGGGNVGTIGAWGPVGGSVTATDTIAGIRSGGAVTATLNAPNVGGITEFDTSLAASTPLPNIPTSSRDELIADVAAAVAQAKSDRANTAAEIENAKTELAAARAQAANQITDLKAEILAEVAEIQDAAALAIADAQAEASLAQQLAVVDYDAVLDQLRSLAAAVRENWRTIDSYARSSAEAAVQAWAEEIALVEQQLESVDASLSETKQDLQTSVEELRQKRRSGWAKIEADLKEAIAILQGQISLSSVAHTALDVVGMWDETGISDLLNAGLYAIEGDWENASWSALAAVPGAGRYFVSLKWGCKAAKASKTLFLLNRGVNLAQSGHLIQEGIENGSPLQIGLGLLGAAANVRSLGRMNRIFGIGCFYAGTLVHEIIPAQSQLIATPPESPTNNNEQGNFWAWVAAAGALATILILEADRRRRKRTPTIPMQDIDALFSTGYAPIPDQPAVALP